MRKNKIFLGFIFTSIILCVTLCYEFDDSAIWDKLNEHEERFDSMESQLSKINDGIFKLETITSALQQNKYVIGVQQGDGVYTITFNDGSSFEIKDGKVETNAPIIGVKEIDGVYYWTKTINNITEPLYDNAGNKIPVTGGSTPHIKFDKDGYWLISYDRGISYEQIKDEEGNPIRAKVDGGDSFFESVTYSKEKLIIVMTNGQVFNFPVQIVTYSKTLPVIHITTENNEPIVSKEVYLNATYYLETFGLEGYTPIGDKNNQLDLEIRGRGNSTWVGYDKKPYRLKLGKKQPILGLIKSKHFALLACIGSYNHISNAVGFEMGDMLGLKWSPKMKPVEVVINNEYKGMYFLSETVRIDEDRLDIFEQPDNSENPEEIKGGWLIEIDNNWDVSQLYLTSVSGMKYRITYKTPEELSQKQKDYLTEQMNAIDKAIYNPDKKSTEWQNYLDLDALARYYIIQEVTDNYDAFIGSTYLFKELGNETKWTMGPLWDLAGLGWRTKNKFIYDEPRYSGQVWIGEIAKYPAFQEKVREVWSEFYAKYETLNTFIDESFTNLEGAQECDVKRWPQYNGGTIETKIKLAKDILHKNVTWLNSQWSTPYQP